MESNALDAADVMPAFARGPLRLMLRPEEGAEAIGVSRARFYELLAEGRIKSIKVGRSRRVPVSELNQWIADELAAQGAA